jgi:RecB family exonuclease
VSGATVEARRGPTISIVDQDDRGGVSTSTLVERAMLTDQPQPVSALIDDWLISSGTIGMPNHARISEAIVELDRFEVNPRTLTTVGYHGNRLGCLLESFQKWYREHSDRLSDTAPLPLEPWSLASADISISAPAELARLAGFASDNAKLTISRWRSPEFDPSVRRIIEQLTTEGFTLSGQFQWAPRPTVDANVHQFADPDEEVAWVLAELSNLVHHGDFATDEIVIYAPSEPSYQRALRHYSTSFGLPIYRHDKRRADVTNLGRHLMELVEFLEFGRVLGSAHRSRALANLVAQTGVPSHDVGRGELTSWFTRTMDHLVKRPGLSSQVTPLDLRLVADLTLELERSPTAGRENTTVTEFLGVVLQLLHLIDLDTASNTNGIRVADLGSQIHSYALVAVLGAVDGHFPSVLAENPVLPLAVRDRIEGLPTTAELVQMRRIGAIGALQAARRHLIVTTAKRIGSERTLPSLLLEELGLLATSAPPRFAVLPMERQPLVPAATPLGERLDQAVTIERSRIHESEPGEYTGQVGPLSARSLSPTQLEDLGQCPFRWFLKHHLRVHAPDEATNEPDPRLLGQLVHAVLERLTEQERSELDVLAIESMLQAHASPSLQEQTPNWRPIRAEIAKQLWAVINHPEFAPPGYFPRVELELRGDWYGIPVVGRIDRLDETGPEGHRIIDYKYSKSAPVGIQNAERRLVVDVQLSVYTQLVEQCVGHVVSAKYCLVKKAEFIKPPGSSKGDTPAIEASALIAERLRTGCLPVAPDGDRLACKYCDHAQACRIASANAG